MPSHQLQTCSFEMAQRGRVKCPSRPIRSSEATDDVPTNPRQSVGHLRDRFALSACEQSGCPAEHLDSNADLFRKKQRRGVPGDPLGNQIQTAINEDRLGLGRTRGILQHCIQGGRVVAPRVVGNRAPPACVVPQNAATPVRVNRRPDGHRQPREMQPGWIMNS